METLTSARGSVKALAPTESPTFVRERGIVFEPRIKYGCLAVCVACFSVSRVFVCACLACLGVRVWVGVTRVWVSGFESPFLF